MERKQLPLQIFEGWVGGYKNIEYENYNDSVTF